MKIKDVELDEGKYDEVAELFARDIVKEDRICTQKPCPIPSSQDDAEGIQPDVLDANFFPQYKTLMGFIENDKEKSNIKGSVLVVAIVLITIMCVGLPGAFLICYPKKTDSAVCSCFLFVAMLLFIVVLVYACIKLVTTWQKNMVSLEEKRQSFVYRMYEQAFQMKNLKLKIWQQEKEELLKTRQKKTLMMMDAEQQNLSYRQKMKEKEMAFLDAYLKHGDNVIDNVGRILSKKE